MYTDVLCVAYNEMPTIAMETFLFHDEYSMYNEDATGAHQLDNFIYYQLFGCA